MIDFTQSHFALFGLTQTFAQDSRVLDARYREQVAAYHPDRFASAPDAEKRLSLQAATRVNEAYQTLRKPLPRAQYLLSLSGHDVDGHSNTAMPPEFLMEQMEWREAVAEARAGRDADELEQLHHRVKQRMNERYEQLAGSLDEQDYARAADRVRRLMFLDKLLFEIDDALAALDE